MSSLSVIRDAIKSTVGTAIDALSVYDTVPESPNLPALVVMPAEDAADFQTAMGRGLDTWNFDLFVLCSYAEAELGQDALDSYVTGAGATSIREAIFNAKALGLTDCSAHVASVRNYGARFAAAGIDHVGAVLRLVVLTSGTG
jgi:hypothetical protein